jgi:hypothetical protein
MRKLIVSVAAAALVASAAPAFADHATGHLSSPVGEPLEGPPVVEHGNWEFIANFPAGAGAENPIGVDVEIFKRRIDGDVHKFAIMSSVTMGFSIFDITKPGSPERVSDYGAALCGPEAQAQQLIDVLVGGQDFSEGSTALGAAHGWEDDVQITPDGKIAILASDAAGRCHDPGWGGLELVDVSDPTSPSLLGLVRLQGESHNSTIDLDRPWLVYNSNSDTSGNDFVDIVDFSSCLRLDPQKCFPEVNRFQFKTGWTVGSKTPAPSACHDITYMLHKLWGACVNSTMVFDPSGLWRHGELTGADLTNRKVVGKKNACEKIDPSVEAMVELKVVDCSAWTEEKWKEADLPNAHLKLLSRIEHAGVRLDEDAPIREDIQISHKSDPLYGGRIVMVNDERGGGLNAPPGQCPGGGLWFFDMRNSNHPKVARTPKGKKAVFTPTPDDTVQAEGSNCTSHLMWRWRRAGRFIAIAWYSSGTQTFRYKVDFSTRPATVSFYDRKAFVPPGASTWTSRVYHQKTLKDGRKELFFVATDIARGFDFFKLILPKNRKN